MPLRANENKVKFGLKRVAFAIATIAPDGSATYDTPITFPGARALSMEPQGTGEAWYSDDGVYYYNTAPSARQGDLEMARMIDSFKEHVLGYVQDTNGLMLEDMNPVTVHFALLFETMNDKRPRRYVMYNCVATASTVGSNTNEGSKEPQTETTTINSMGIYVASHGKWFDHAETTPRTDPEAYANWFNAVQLPAPPADPYPIKTKSGPVVNITDGAPLPIASLIANVEPVQSGSGAPAPDNVRAISGWTGANVSGTGKNLANLSNDNLGSNQTSTFQYENGGVVVTATGRYARAGWLIPVVKGMTYTISYDVVASDSDGMNNKVFYGSKDGVWYASAEGYIAQTDFTTTKTAKTYTFTASSDTLFFGVYVTSLATTGSATVTNLQVEPNSTATPYKPYAGQTYDITFPAEAGTVYGGTLDVTNGVLTVDRAMVTIDENTAISISTSSHRAYTNSAVGKPVSGNAVVSDTLISDYLPTVSVNAIYISNTTGVAISNTGTLNFNIPGVTNGDSFTVNDVKTYLASHNLHVVCGIEAVTYQLTPLEVLTLHGDNIIFADCGDVTVQYHSDPDLDFE